METQPQTPTPQTEQRSTSMPQTPKTRTLPSNSTLIMLFISVALLTHVSLTIAGHWYNFKASPRLKTVIQLLKSGHNDLR